MAKPVTGQTTFGSNTTGTTTQLDNNFLLAYNALNDLNTYSNFLTDTGSVNSIVVTLAANLTGALTNGLMIQVKVAATNTGSTTLNYNAGGGLNVLNPDGTSLLANQIISSGIYQFIYRASDTSWLLMGAAGGAMVPLVSQQANNNVTIDFNNALSATYRNYKLLLSNIVACSNGASFFMTFGNGNGPTYLGGTNYAYALTEAFATGANAIRSFGGTNAFLLFAGVLGNSAYYSYDADITIFAPSSNAPCKFTASVSYISSANDVYTSLVGGGVLNANTTITSVRLSLSAGNFASGTVSLYGIK